MSRQARIPLSSPSPSPSVNKRQPLLRHSQSSNSSHCNGHFVELAGGTTAECATLCCCCPCGIVNLLILIVYKLPAGLCRRAMKKKRLQKMIKRGLFPPRTGKYKCGYDDTELPIHPLAGHNASAEEEEELTEKEKEAMVMLETEMWESFYGAGFWRNPSQREASANKKTTAVSPRETPLVKVLATTSHHN